MGQTLCLLYSECPLYSMTVLERFHCILMQVNKSVKCQVLLLLQVLPQFLLRQQVPVVRVFLVYRACQGNLRLRFLLYRHDLLGPRANHQVPCFHHYQVNQMDRNDPADRLVLGYRLPHSFHQCLELRGRILALIDLVIRGSQVL